jgi:hypothetical protein
VAELSGEAALALDRFLGHLSSRNASPRTVVEYRPGYRAEGARLARDLHVAAVSPLDGLKKSDLLGAQVALILGT